MWRVPRGSIDGCHLVAVTLCAVFTGACSPHRDYSTSDTGPAPADDTARPDVAIDTAPPYPDGPYGLHEGEVFPNVRFSGYRDGVAPWRTDLSMADYYDPEATRLHVVMVDIGAAWCPPCKSLAEVLPGLHAQFRPRGAEFVSLLAEAGLPATTASQKTVDAWLEAYALPFTTGIDPERAAVPSNPDEVGFPMEYFVDVRSMVILSVMKGYDPTKPAQLPAKIEAVLVTTGVPPLVDAGDDADSD